MYIHFKPQHVSVFHKPSSWSIRLFKKQQYSCIVSNPTTHRLEHNYTVGFLKYRMLPEVGFWKTETCWSLECVYMIFDFLMILIV
jgi:hypothetical protein